MMQAIEIEARGQVAIDHRVLREDYRNYDLIARYWKDEYRRRIWKNKKVIADCEDGAHLDVIQPHFRPVVDDLLEGDEALVANG